MRTAEEKKERLFFVVVFGAAVVYAALAAFRGHTLRAGLIGAFGSLLLAFHLLLPGPAAAFFKLYSALMSKIGVFLTKSFMVLFFYVIFCPYGLVLRLLRGDLLHRRPEPGRSSYWIAKTTQADCRQPF